MSSVVQIGKIPGVITCRNSASAAAYDGLARLTATYVGTDDSTTNGFKWTPSNASPTSNIAQVAASEYDNGGVGNGNLTKITLAPGGGASPRDTQIAHDWCNGLVATKFGATSDLATESPSVHRPLSFTDYENLGA